MLSPSPGWTQSGRHPQSSPVRASSACRQPPLPPHRLQPMVLNDGPTPAAVRLCCRAAAGSNRGTRSSDWHRGGSQPRPTVSVCALDPVASMDALFSFFSFSVLCLFPSPPHPPGPQDAARRRREARGAPAALRLSWQGSCRRAKRRVGRCHPVLPATPHSRGPARVQTSDPLGRA